MRRRVVSLAVAAVIVAGCSSDVTDTEEYRALEERLGELEAENLRLSAEVAELTQGDSMLEVEVFYECTDATPPEGIAPPMSPTGGSPLIPIAGVTLHGAPFMDRGTPVEEFKWGCGFEVEPASLIDGLFFEQSQYWDEGAVWWDTNDGQERWIELELEGTFTVDAAIVQADDNDSYLLSYRDPQTGEWEPLWHVPAAYLFGMQTRPNPGDNTERHEFDEPVATDRLRFEADSGDNLFSVSEIQVFGTPAD